MRTINYEISKLLETNRALFEGKPIAFDGVIDEEVFRRTKIRTIFLLKEVNVPGMSKDWVSFMEDTKQQASKESMYQTWPNICLWVEALRNTNTNYMDCVDEYGTFATKMLQKNLLEVGIVNIKKTAGGGSSDYDEISKAVKKYGKIICEEIEECIKPDLVICGGTFDYAKEIFKVADKNIMSLSSGAQYFRKNGIIYIQFVHPAWFSVNRKILFAYAKAVFADVHKLFSR